MTTADKLARAGANWRAYIKRDTALRANENNDNEKRNPILIGLIRFVGALPDRYPAIHPAAGQQRTGEIIQISPVLLDWPDDRAHDEPLMGSLERDRRERIDRPPD